MLARKGGPPFSRWQPLYFQDQRLSPPPTLALLARDIDSEAECISHFRYPNTWVEQPDLPAAAGQVWSYDTPSLEIALQSL